MKARIDESIDFTLFGRTFKVRTLKVIFVKLIYFYGSLIMSSMMITVRTGIFYKMEDDFRLYSILAPLSLIIMHTLMLCCLWNENSYTSKTQKAVRLLQTSQEYCIQFLHIYASCIMVMMLHALLAGNCNFYEFLYIFTTVMTPEVLVYMIYRCIRWILNICPKEPTQNIEAYSRLPIREKLKCIEIFIKYFIVTDILIMICVVLIILFTDENYTMPATYMASLGPYYIKFFFFVVLGITLSHYWIK